MKDELKELQEKISEAYSVMPVEQLYKINRDLTDLQAQNDELRANNSKLRESLRDACMYLACTIDISKYVSVLESTPTQSLADIRAEAVMDYEASLSSFAWTAEEYIANKIKVAE